MSNRLKDFKQILANYITDLYNKIYKEKDKNTKYKLQDQYLKYKEIWDRIEMIEDIGIQDYNQPINELKQMNDEFEQEIKNMQTNQITSKPKDTQKDIKNKDTRQATSEEINEFLEK